MKTHNLTQGSPEWLAYRATMRNSSDAPAMMGCSPYKSRAELLREVHTGVAADVDIATQKRFDNGHRAEALARPLAEEFIGEELYPVTGSLGRLSASFDGLTMDESTGFEHKALNEALKSAFAAIGSLKGGGDEAPGRLLPIYHRVQMEQQLHISGAGRVLFMASEWTADGELVEEHSVYYMPDLELRQQILDGWAQFERDLAAYTLQPRTEKVEAAPVEALPAVAVRMDGALVVHSNLPAFGAALRAFVERIPKAPTTDQEFADTEAACKALKRAEDALDAAEANALASMADVESMRRLVADFRSLARETRLERSKMVERRKVELKERAVLDARRALDLHIEVVNAEIAPMRLLPVAADFAGAIKGLKSLDSMHDKLGAALAAAKIAADTQGRAIRKNCEHFKEVTNIGTAALFPDLHQLVHKSPEDFRDVVQSRVLAQQERDRKAEAERQAAEAQRIAAAEQRAREQEAAKIARQAEDARVAALAEQRRQDAAAESARIAAAAPAAPVVAVQACRPEDRAVLATSAGAAMAAKAAEALLAQEPATLTLRTICDRLRFVVSAQFLADDLHVQPARRDRTLIKRQGEFDAANLYTERQFGLICRQLASHVSAMAELYAGEPA